MTLAAWITLGVLALVLAMLMSTRRSPDVIIWGGVALLLIVPVPSQAGWTYGVLSTSEALGGLANAGMVTVAVLFVVAAGLRETGAMGWLAGGLLGRPKSLAAAQSRIMLPMAGLSAFLNNTPLVAIMLPVIGDWARRNKISVSKLLMPLSYAAILGGTCSLVGTSTNLVISGLVLETDGIAPLGMFTITWVGLPCAIIGIVYMLVIGRRLLPERIPVLDTMDDAREYTVEMIVEEASPLDGKTIEEAGLRHLPGLFLIEIERNNSVLAAVSSSVRLKENDRLVFVGIVESVVDLQKIRGLRPATNQVFKLDESRSNRVLVEAVVSNTCPLIGRTIREGRFRTVYNAAVIAVARNGVRITDMKIGDIRIEAGDVLLLDTRRSFAEQQRNSRDFYLVSSVNDSTTPRHDRAPIAIAILSLMVVGVTFGLIDMLRAGLIAAGLMIVTRCTTASGARKFVDFQVLLVIAGALGLGAAMQASGAAGSIASTLIAFAGDNPYVLMVIIYIMTTLFTEMITNNAAAVLVYPIALNAVAEISADTVAAGGDPLNPMPFIIAIMVAASASFSTPIGYQTNLMVYGPGGYRFTDFMKVGIPLSLLVMAATVTIAPLVWPF